MRLWKQKARPASGPARARWLAVGLAALTLAVAGGFVRETLRSRQIDSEIAALRAEAERLRAKNFEIASMRSTFGQTEFTEREARLKLGLRKEGEQVVVIRQAAPVAAPETPSVEAARPAASNPRKWWLYFMDKPSFEAYGAPRTEPAQEFRPG